MLRLHKDYGVNPTISLCAICGKEKNEIALLGAAYKGQAPMHMVTGLEPCDECRKTYLSKGVMLAEVDDKRRPTGRFVVIRTEAFERNFTVPIPPKRIALVEARVFERIIPDGHEATDEEH